MAQLCMLTAFERGGNSLERFKDLNRHDLALVVLHVPYSLDSGTMPGRKS